MDVSTGELSINITLSLRGRVCGLHRDDRAMTTVNVHMTGSLSQNGCPLLIDDMMILMVLHYLDTSHTHSHVHGVG